MRTSTAVAPLVRNSNQIYTKLQPSVSKTKESQRSKICIVIVTNASDHRILFDQNIMRFEMNTHTHKPVCLSTITMGKVRPVRLSELYTNEILPRILFLVVQTP